MYAIVESGGFQFSVKEGDKIRAPRLNAGPKEKLVLDKVLFIGGEAPQVGRPYVSGAQVEAEVIGPGRSPKIVVFKKRKRVKYRRTRGHRQDFTEIRIDKIIPPR
jgi:large subunit ribosomal protein L21